MNPWVMLEKEIRVFTHSVAHITDSINSTREYFPSNPRTFIRQFCCPETIAMQKDIVKSVDPQGFRIRLEDSPQLEEDRSPIPFDKVL